MFDSTKISLLAAVIQGEERKITEGVDAQFLENTDEFSEGNVLFKIMPKRKSCNDLLTRTRVIVDRDKLNGSFTQTSWKPLFEDVTHDIITTDTPMTFKNAVLSINKLYKALGNTMYGVLLISEDKRVRINPLHPITALYMVDNPLDTVLGWTIAIYTYKDKKNMDDVYKTDSASKELIVANLNSLIQCYAGKAPTKMKVTGRSYNSVRKRVSVKYKIGIHADEYTDYGTSLVTHQILTAGTIAPYYGTSIIRKEYRSREVSGIWVSPMISSNIDTAEQEIPLSGFQNNDCAQEDVKLRYGAVCTGARDNKTPHGLRSLTHSNTASPYNSRIIADGALAYVTGCIEKSIEIYTLAGIIKGTKENAK